MHEPDLALDERNQEGAGLPQFEHSPFDELVGLPVRVVLVLGEVGVEVVATSVLFAFDSVSDRALDVLATQLVEQKVVPHARPLGVAC